MSVPSIKLFVGNDQFKLLWGLPKGYSDTNIATKIELYRAASTSLIGPLNSFNIGFYINGTSPINAIFQVYINVGATGILEGSIVHNLPSTGNG